MKIFNFLYLFLIFSISFDLKSAKSGVFKANADECPSGSSIIKCSNDSSCAYAWGPDAFCKNGTCYIKEDICYEDQECIDILEKK